LINNLWFLFGNLFVFYVIYWAWMQDVAKGQELGQQQSGKVRYDKQR